MDLDIQEPKEEVNDILESIVYCVDRGEGRGKAHVFIDWNDRCQCGERVLKTSYPRKDSE